MTQKFIFLICLSVGLLVAGGVAQAKPLLPNGPGVYSDWTGNYTQVREYPTVDGDSSYNAVSTENAKQSYTVQFCGDNCRGTISGVSLTSMAKAGGANSENLRLFLRLNSTDYEASSVCSTINNTAYTQCFYYWSLNPNTGSSWTDSDFTGMEIGFKSEARGAWDGDEQRVTQFYLDIDFVSDLKKVKFDILNKIAPYSGSSDDGFTFSLDEPVNEIQSAFVEFNGLAYPVGGMTLGLAVDDNAGPPGLYVDHNIGATGRPISFKVNFDVTDYFRSFASLAGTYSRYLHSNPSSNVYLAGATLTVVYSRIKPPPPQTGNYRISGDLFSAIFDSGSVEGPAVNSIYWRAPGGSGLNGGRVRFQLAAANNPAGPWNYFGGNSCLVSDWFEPSGPDAPTEVGCFSLFKNNRYFRYKMELCSKDCATGGSNTPEVNSVIVNWSPQ